MKKFKIITIIVTTILTAICQKSLALTTGIKNRSASRPNSKTIVKALPAINFQNSLNFSLNPFASE